MRWILAVALATSLTACKRNEKPDPSATRDATTATPGDAVVATAPADAPPPPPDASKPTVTEATAALTAVLTKIGEKTGVALMHGCAEGADRVAELFDEAADSSRELKAWMADEKLRAELAAVVDKRSDSALAAALAKLDADIGDCKRAAEARKKGIETLLAP